MIISAGGSYLQDTYRFAPHWPQMSSSGNFEGVFGSDQAHFWLVFAPIHNHRGNIDIPQYIGNQAAFKTVGFSRRIGIDAGYGRSVSQESRW